MKKTTMKIREKLFGTFVALGLLGASFTAQAASISLVSATDASLGDPVAVEIWMDFTGDPTLGGGFNINFDNSILGDDWTFGFDADFYALVDPAFTGEPTYGVSGEVTRAYFGDFNGVGGNNLVGTVIFNAIGEGLSALVVSESPGSFYDLTGTKQTVDYFNTSVTVSAVPVPAAAWLMLSGLGAVFGFCKRKSSNIVTA